MTTLEEKIDLVLRWIMTDDSLEKMDIEMQISKILNDTSTNAQPSETETEIIKSYLLEIGIMPNLAGFRYLTRAIELYRDRRDYYREGITSRLYPDVARWFDTTPPRVERSIRHAIETAYDGGLGYKHHAADFSSSVNFKKGKCTNSAFIAICDEVIERRMKRRVCV